MLIKRKKIQLFKFWPKHVLRNAWKKYIYAGDSEQNLNAAHISVQVLDKVAEQFVLNCIKKLDRKAAKLGQQVNKQEEVLLGGTRAGSRGGKGGMGIYGFAGQNTNRYNKQADYTKYFASSSDENDYGEEDNDESDIAQAQSRAKRADKRHTKRYGKESEDDDVSKISDDEEDSNDEDNDKGGSGAKGSRKAAPSHTGRFVSRGGRVVKNTQSNLPFASARNTSQQSQRGNSRAARSAGRKAGRNGGEEDLVAQYGYKAPTGNSRLERARLRNLKKGGASSSSDEQD